MARINIYLSFDGTCSEAFARYRDVLGGTITVMERYGDLPTEAAMPGANPDHIMHGRLELGDSILMASDAPPGRYRAPQGFNVQMSFDDQPRAQEVFDALAERGDVHMPLSATFFSRSFGMVTDRFGIPWMINCA